MHFASFSKARHAMIVLMEIRFVRIFKRQNYNNAILIFFILKAFFFSEHFTIFFDLKFKFEI